MSPRETYESLNIEPKPFRPHVVAAVTVVFGDDYYNGRRETITFSGFTQINKWPMPGFEHRVDENGHAALEAELISAPEVGVKGYSYELSDRVQILTNPFLPNLGHIRQIAPGKNFPAEFQLRRFGILETSTLRLAHRNAMETSGVVDAIPPFKRPLTGPVLGFPRGAGSEVAPAPGVLRATGLPEAWYPANDENEPVGITPTLFFAPAPSPFMTMLFDPSMIVQATIEGSLTLAVNGKTVKVDLTGEHGKAAGAELLLFGPDKHDEGSGVQAQLSRLAVVGECAELGGRIMLRTAWARPSGGSFGKGEEEALSRLAYPADLHLDTHLEVCTPHGTLYADAAVPLAGRAADLEANGTELRAESDVPLLAQDGTTKARLTDVKLVMRDTYVGETATVNI
ncbi:DUF6004 family protein [Streptomyces sp. NPDC017868]|uniref:DUF6004 family protein n=1 Tax=Streptomyces sp. NPDC017868 TaxID=3365014 RepID=UPI0037BC9F4E